MCGCLGWHWPGSTSRASWDEDDAWIRVPSEFGEYPQYMCFDGSSALCCLLNRSIGISFMSADAFTDRRNWVPFFPIDRR